MGDRYVMRLFEDVLEPGAASSLETGHNRVFYVVEGEASVASAEEARGLGANQACRTDGPVTLESADGATVWRYEILPAVGADEGLLTGKGVVSALKLAAETALPEADGYLMRCDRADFPLGAETPKHTHQGPGIRCLLRGEIHAEIGDHRATYRKGEAWFERGPDPVVGRSSDRLETGFVRVMVLPRRLLGQSSFQYYDDAERAKPRTQSFEIFLDEPIELSAGVS